MAITTIATTTTATTTTTAITTMQKNVDHKQEYRCPVGFRVHKCKILAIF